jgi:hypothetical protein
LVITFLNDVTSINEGDYVISSGLPDVTFLVRNSEGENGHTMMIDEHGTLVE